MATSPRIPSDSLDAAKSALNDASALLEATIELMDVAIDHYDNPALCQCAQVTLRRVDESLQQALAELGRREAAEQLAPS